MPTTRCRRTSRAASLSTRWRSAVPTSTVVPQNATAIAGTASFGDLALNDAADAYTIGAIATGCDRCDEQQLQRHCVTSDVTCRSPTCAPETRSAVSRSTRRQRQHRRELRRQRRRSTRRATGGSNFGGGTADEPAAIAGAATVRQPHVDERRQRIHADSRRRRAHDVVSSSFDVTAGQLVITDHRLRRAGRHAVRRPGRSPRCRQRRRRELRGNGRARRRSGSWRQLHRRHTEPRPPAAARRPSRAWRSSTPADGVHRHRELQSGCSTRSATRSTSRPAGQTSRSTTSASPEGNAGTT